MKFMKPQVLGLLGALTRRKKKAPKSLHCSKVTCLLEETLGRCRCDRDYRPIKNYKANTFKHWVISTPRNAWSPSKILERCIITTVQSKVVVRVASYIPLTPKASKRRCAEIWCCFSQYAHWNVDFSSPTTWHMSWTAFYQRFLLDAALVDKIYRACRVRPWFCLTSLQTRRSWVLERPTCFKPATRDFVEKRLSVFRF